LGVRRLPVGSLGDVTGRSVRSPPSSHRTTFFFEQSEGFNNTPDFPDFCPILQRKCFTISTLYVFYQGWLAKNPAQGVRNNPNTACLSSTQFVDVRPQRGYQLKKTLAILAEPSVSWPVRPPGRE
jgi:hypothetical protein